MRREDGMTLIEVMVTVLVICVGTLATLGTYAHFSSATNVARERGVLNSVAQREIERLRPLTYAQLGLSSQPPASAASAAPRTGKAAAEALVVDGIVSPGGDEFVYDGVRMRVYRYVTKRNQTCNGLTPKIQGELSTLLNQTLTVIQDTLDSACPALLTTKRITVVAVPVKTDGTTAKGITLSTVKQDPTSNGLLPVDTSGLSLKPVTSTLDEGAGAVPPATQSQTVTLLDTRCSDSARDYPSSHQTRDTSQEASISCSNSGPAPTLMTLAGIPGSTSEPIADFSTDITRAAAGGLAMLRDTTAGSCTAPTNIVYKNAEAAQRMRSIHTWATTVPAQAMEIPSGGGRASLKLYTSTADGTAGPARLCVTLRRYVGGQIIGASDFRLKAWPAKATELVTSFDLDPQTIPAGQRLLLTVRVPADSEEDLRILYDHPAYQSSLTFTTVAGKGLS